MAAQVSVSNTADSSVPILVVDDDLPVRESLQFVLGLFDLLVALVVNGVEAMAWLTTHRPVLVLLDLSMPVAVGGEVAAALRAQYGPSIPIVVLSASTYGDERVRQLGAQAFLRKPFNLVALLDVVRQALHFSSEGHDQDGSGAPVPRA